MTIEAFRADLIKKMGEDNFNKVRSVRIGIAGAGGLGSNCALNLVRVGFEKFTIADFDCVDASNLDRQFYFLDQVGMYKVEALKTNLRRINPGLDLKILKERIEKNNAKDIFADCDIVAECLDTAACKKTLLEELLIAKKFVVAVSGLGGVGSSDEIRIHQVKENLVMIGDLKSDICQKPALSPRVNVAAAKQADVILERVINVM
ncbi:MAG: sulfur carrier protein ThiS adenylyltransferase ThiF [Candidatus Omnitrophota bacterium]|nr:sulfur carrier protein ThiS adenylyltransferase ThiF [Candidatus Omnitrophota bacterium]